MVKWSWDNPATLFRAAAGFVFKDELSHRSKNRSCIARQRAKGQDGLERSKLIVFLRVPAQRAFAFFAAIFLFFSSFVFIVFPSVSIYTSSKRNAKAVARTPAMRNWGTLFMRNRAVKLSTNPTAMASNPRAR